MFAKRGPYFKIFEYLGPCVFIIIIILFMVFNNLKNICIVSKKIQNKRIFYIGMLRRMTPKFDREWKL